MVSTEPCPNCGSADVHWRSARLLDGVFTYIRHAADNVLGSLLRSKHTQSPIRGYSPRSDELRADALRYEVQRKLYENRVGTMTASRFWSCGHCHKKGQVFDNLDEVIAGRRELTSLQNEISDNLGTVMKPIEEDLPRDD